MNKGVNKQFTTGISDSQFMLKEEEASMINFFINSFKRSKDEKKAENNTKGKSLKELIAESAREVEETKQKQKSLLDWQSLQVTVSKAERDKINVNNFGMTHYSNVKPVKKQPEEVKIGGDLGIIKEQSEETEHRTNKSRNELRARKENYELPPAPVHMSPRLSFRNNIPSNFSEMSLMQLS